MRHEDCGDAKLALDEADFLAQRHADLGIKRRERFVEKENLRLVGKRAGQRHALLLAARHLIWVTIRQMAEMDQVQHLLHAGVDLGL